MSHEHLPVFSWGSEGVKGTPVSLAAMPEKVTTLFGSELSNAHDPHSDADPIGERHAMAVR